MRICWRAGHDEGLAAGGQFTFAAANRNDRSVAILADVHAILARPRQS
jgi:hypothetical protein